MAKDSDGQRSGSGGAGPVLLIVCLLIVVSFVGDDHPMDRLADIIMIITWCIAIGFLLFVLLFAFAYYFQTAIMDLYESTLEDMEHSRLKERLIAFRTFLEGYVFNGFKKKPDANKTSAGDQDEKTGAGPEKGTGFIGRMKELKARSSEYLDKKQEKDSEEAIDDDDYRAFEEDVLREIEKDKERKR